MENQTDDKVAVSMVTDAQKKFPSIVQASYYERYPYRRQAEA
jgi:hypothetical protein